MYMYIPPTWYRHILAGLVCLCLLPHIVEAKVSKNRQGFGAHMDIPIVSQLGTKSGLGTFTQRNVRPAGVISTRHWTSPTFCWGLHLGINYLFDGRDSEDLFMQKFGFTLIGVLLRRTQLRVYAGARISMLYFSSIRAPIPFPTQLQVEPILGSEFFLLSHRKASVSLSLGLPLSGTISAGGQPVASIESLNFTLGVHYYFD